MSEQEKFKVKFINYDKVEDGYLLSSRQELRYNLFEVIHNHIFKPTGYWWYGINSKYDLYDQWLSEKFFPKVP